MSVGKTRDPLQFAYIELSLLDEDGPRSGIYKVFYVDDIKIRVRAITLGRTVHGDLAKNGGGEYEGDNVWIPWSAIRTLTEVDVK